MFGFIKKLIGGIFGFLGGLFGKKDEYFLELKDEVEETTPAEPAPATKVEPAKPVAATKVETAEPVAATKVEPAKATKAKVAEPTPAEPTKETTFAPKYLIPQATNVRRRPGANMNSFLDMASQVKAPG
ncbi:MAG: hypothetical protein F6K62_21360 [Sphaerospermopsis sp. SIO1G2]|nr:hypothetical protein [Sphaerospermopsis sp. SIO1G2]